MSKLCLVEVGKFLDILKSQHWFKWPKIANGPIFLPWFIILSMCTTTWPKGKYFLILYLCIWIFIYINSFKSFKIYEKSLIHPNQSFYTCFELNISCLYNYGKIWLDWNTFREPWGSYWNENYPLNRPVTMISELSF